MLTLAFGLVFSGEEGSHSVEHQNVLPSIVLHRGFLPVLLRAESDVVSACFWAHFWGQCEKHRVLRSIFLMSAKRTERLSTAVAVFGVEVSVAGGGVSYCSTVQVAIAFVCFPLYCLDQS